LKSKLLHLEKISVYLTSLFSILLRYKFDLILNCKVVCGGVDRFFKYRDNESGQVAVIFAMAALPLLALTSVAVEHVQLTSERNAISNGLDAAVLAAANNNAITISEKDDYAKTYFIANYDGDIPLELASNIESDRVRLSAKGEMDLTLGKILGINNPTMIETSAATIANENTICLMSLNETSAESILFDGGIEYRSPSCAVYSNSVNSSAIMSRSRTVPTAKSFCAVGGLKGDFLPYAKGECAPLADPYANLVPPEIPSDCNTPYEELIEIKDVRSDNLREIDIADAQARLLHAFDVLQETESLSAAFQAFQNYTTTPIYDEDLKDTIDVSDNRTGSQVNILPGTFCGGLTVDGIDVDFLPGEYIIKDGPLSFINGAEARANDVTFVLSGKGSVLNIQSKSKVKLKAPSQGERKGLAVMEAIDPKAPGNQTYENRTSLIAEGGSLEVLGTIYLPKQKLEILGQNTSIGSLAPATSFIADRLHISGGVGAKMTIEVDHQSAGVPPILPRAEDGARLVE